MCDQTTLQPYFSFMLGVFPIDMLYIIPFREYAYVLVPDS